MNKNKQRRPHIFPVKICSCRIPLLADRDKNLYLLRKERKRRGRGHYGICNFVERLPAHKRGASSSHSNMNFIKISGPLLMVSWFQPFYAAKNWGVSHPKSNAR
jgi:hypothetical protein